MDAVGGLLAPLLGTLERVVWVQRHLPPPLQALSTADCPEDLAFLRDRLVDVTTQTLEMVTAFIEAAAGSADPFDLYRALRRFSRAQEALYPLAPILEPVSRWFLPPERRDDARRVLPLRPRVLGWRLRATPGRRAPRRPRPRARLPLELAPRGPGRRGAAAEPDVAGPHVVDHGRRGRR